MRLLIPAVLVLAFPFRGSASESSPGVIRVTAACPGADARTLDETVLLPLFGQISGVEEMIRIETLARHDGSGILTAYFWPDADLNLAEVRVQNRVNLALPKLPERCRQLGISVRKQPPGPPRFWLAVTSTDPSADESFLRQYAMVNLTPWCAHRRGVSEVRIVGGAEFDLRVRLDWNRLTAHSLTARDVIDALRRQNVEVGAAGALNGYYPFAAAGRLTTPAEFESVILRTGANGGVVRLKDVARVELVFSAGGFAAVDGEPAALMAISAWPGRAILDRFLKETTGDLPANMSLSSLADRSSDRLLSVEVQLPEGTRLERTQEVVAEATKKIRELSGEPRLFAFAEGNEPNTAMLFVKAGAEGKPAVADVEGALAGIAGARIRVGDVPPGADAFPVRIALVDPTEIRDPGEAGEKRFWEAAEGVLATLVKDKNLVRAPYPSSLAPQYAVDVDRDKCAQHEIELDDLFTTLQTSLGGVAATEFTRLGQRFRVTVETAREFARFTEDLANLMVRGPGGEMVSLDKLVRIRRTTVPAQVVRINGYRAIYINAATTDGKSPAEVAAKCVERAREVLPREYRVMDLTGTLEE